MTRLLLAFIIAVALAGCEKPDDVTQIRTIVLDIVDRAQAHDISGMMEHATRDFSASPGSHDEQKVRGVLLISFRRLGKFQLKHPEPGIKLGKDARTATVSLPFLVVREGQEMPDLSSVTNDPAAWLDQAQTAVGDPYTVKMDLTKTGDGWKVREAEISGFKRYDQL